MKRHAVLLPVVLALASSGALAQSTWYVDVNGTPPGTGTQSDPYTSIQYAVSRPTTLSGHTLVVAPGEYREAVDSLSLGKALTIRSTGGPAVTSIRSDAPYTVRLEYGTFFGFTVRNDTVQSGTAVEACNTTILRCVITGKFNGLSVCGWVPLEESTITGNVLGLETVSVHDFAFIKNSIVWGNNANWGPYPQFQAKYSLFNVPFNGTGNLVGDPWLWNAAACDMHLKPGSICIDAGDPASQLDPDGSRSDIGALIYDPTYAYGPEIYCTGKLNSHGCVSSISSSGACSASNPAPFFVDGSNIVVNKLGLLYYGFAPRSVPFQGGTHCVEPPIKRCEVLFSGTNGLPPPGNLCSGTFSYDFNARIQSGLYPNLTPGQIVYAQYWHRDPPDPTGFGTGLTNAISFGIAP